MSISKHLLKSGAKQDERYSNETEDRLVKALFVVRQLEARKIVYEIDKRIDELESRLSR